LRVLKKEEDRCFPIYQEILDWNTIEKNVTVDDKND
jgi:hypothetical protein